MKNEHNQVREAIAAAARASATSRAGTREFLALARLADAITPEGAAKLRRLLK